VATKQGGIYFVQSFQSYSYYYKEATKQGQHLIVEIQLSPSLPTSHHYIHTNPYIYIKMSVALVFHFRDRQTYFMEKRTDTNRRTDRKTEGQLPDVSPESSQDHPQHCPLQMTTPLFFSY